MVLKGRPYQAWCFMRRFFGMPVFPPGIRVAPDAWIGRGVEFDWSYGFMIEVRDRAIIAQGARLLCHDASSRSRLGATWAAPIVVDRDAFVGTEVLIMPGVTIGEGAVVASRAVVTHDVEPGMVVAGVPARPVCTVAELDERRMAQLRRIGCVDSSLYLDHEAQFDDLRARAAADGGVFVGSSEVAARYPVHGDDLA